jgi:transcriptional regulator
MGTDLYAVPPNLFKAADQKHIKISIDGVMIVVKLKTQVPDKIRGRLVTDEIDVSVDKNGNLTVA